jgi:hypothetical protein
LKILVVPAHHVCQRLAYQVSLNALLSVRSWRFRAMPQPRTSKSLNINWPRSTTQTQTKATTTPRKSFRMSLRPTNASRTTRSGNSTTPLDRAETLSATRPGRAGSVAVPPTPARGTSSQTSTPRSSSEIFSGISGEHRRARQEVSLTDSATPTLTLARRRSTT